MDTNLLNQVRAKAEAWLNGPYDEATKTDIRKMLADSDTTNLVESFYKDLEFGTGGLRGIMGAGSNRMNIYTVRRATQGLADYVNITVLKYINIAIYAVCLILAYISFFDYFKNFKSLLKKGSE